MLEHYPYKVAALDREMLDISNNGDVERAVATHAPDIVLNCAAYNFVDRAEEDAESAFRVDALGVRNLALTCRKRPPLTDA